MYSIFLKEDKDINGFNWSEISKKDAWRKIMEWKKKTNKFQTYATFTGYEYTQIHGFYNKIKIEGAFIKLSDVRIPSNFFLINARDVVSVRLSEKPEENFETLFFTMRRKYVIQLTPY